MFPAIIILILNWNKPQDTLDCLKSVFALDYPNFQVLVVDNGSENESAQKIFGEFPEIELLELKENLGYTGGNNAGIAHAINNGCDFIWILNDDVVVAPESLSCLVRAAEDEPEGGFFGPVVYCKENPDDILSAGGKFEKELFSKPIGLGKKISWKDSTGLSDVDYLSGCALLVRNKTIADVGPLNGSFFAYHEDVEWCYRGKQKGYRSILVKDARVWPPDTRKRDDVSASVTYYMTRNHLYFLNMYKIDKIILLKKMFGYIKTILSWSLQPKWKYKRAQRDAMARAIYDFLAGHTGKWSV